MAVVSGFEPFFLFTESLHAWADLSPSWGCSCSCLVPKQSILGGFSMANDEETEYSKIW